MFATLGLLRDGELTCPRSILYRTANVYWSAYRRHFGSPIQRRRRLLLSSFTATPSTNTFTTLTVVPQR